MDWQQWRPLYEAVCADFGYDPEADRAAAWRLRGLLPGHDTFRVLGTDLKHRARAVIVGCGPALESLRPGDLPEGVLVACDGATQRLRELGVVPRVVVSDLDGDPASLEWAAGQGASLVVHAHGDNLEALGLVPRLGPFVCGTYQCAPEPGLWPMRNLGGFTDGDRAVLLCEAFQVREVVLVAFDLHAPPSRYSHHYDPHTKPRKLLWAERLILGVQERGRTRVVGMGEARRGVP